MVDLLAKRGPMRGEDLISAVIMLVPPGRAYREYVKQLQRTREKNGTILPLPPPNDNTIRQGQRALIRLTMNKYNHPTAPKAHRWIVVEQIDGEEWVRLLE